MKHHYKSERHHALDRNVQRTRTDWQRPSRHRTKPRGPHPLHWAVLAACVVAMVLVTLWERLP